MAASPPPPTPITILTGFLGSGKTTLILNLLPQLPPSYKLALLKNEFGDLAIDSKLASSSSISGVRELLNGCICCNLVGQLGDALQTLREDVAPDRIIVETSGSAFPATLAMEVNRLARETGAFVLDGVVSVVDVENWEGYEDTSVTARLQARYTDLVVFNKWEGVDERRFEDCLDRLGDLEVPTAWVKSDMGRVGRDVVLGIDGALARELRDDGRDGGGGTDGHSHAHDGKNNHHDHPAPTTPHQSEVEVLSITLSSSSSSTPTDNDAAPPSLDPLKLSTLLTTAPKDEIYRIKSIFHSNNPPTASTNTALTTKDNVPSTPGSKASRYILNWAFGRWTFTPVGEVVEEEGEPVARMTIILARGEAEKWKRKIEGGGYLVLEGGGVGEVRVERIS